jgi:hypothetical protein
MTVYNLWQESDGDQKLELVVSFYLAVFSDIIMMRDHCF